MIHRGTIFNTCKTCGASDGRCGTLINGECLNCADTRRSGAVTYHADKTRTTLELARTAAIVTHATGVYRTVRHTALPVVHLFIMADQRAVCGARPRSAYAIDFDRGIARERVTCQHCLRWLDLWELKFAT